MIRRFGGRKTLAAVYQYGAPPTMGALAALLDEREREGAMRVYCGNVQYSILRSLFAMCGKECSMPSCGDMYEQIYSEQKPQEKQLSNQETLMAVNEMFALFGQKE